MADIFRQQLIGETRLAHVENGQLVAMRISRDGDGPQAGDHVAAQLTKKLGTRGIARHGATELLVEPWPNGATEGATVQLEITRAAWLEPGRERLAKARPANGPTRSAKNNHTPIDNWPEPLADQWDDAFEAASLGLVNFAGGQLVFSLTPACTTVDIDGNGPNLAAPALAALARTIRLWALGGTIIVDVPQTDRAGRHAAVAAFDAAMAGQPHERTAINGFGLLQIICPRHGPSILERARLDRACSEAIARLQSARRDRGHGPLLLDVSPAAGRWLGARPQLLDRLSREIGRPVSLSRQTHQER